MITYVFFYLKSLARASLKFGTKGHEANRKLFESNTPIMELNAGVYVAPMWPE